MQVQDIYLANEFTSVSQGGRLRFLPAGLAESSQLLLRRDKERPWLAQAHRQAAWENTTLQRLPEVPGDKTAILKWHQTKLEMEGRHTLPRFLNTKKVINQKQGLLKYKNGPSRLLTGRTLTHRPDDPSLTFGSHKVTG